MNKWISKTSIITFLSIFLVSNTWLNADSVFTWYRSNSNGLMLLVIPEAKRGSHIYTLRVEKQDDLIYEKVLYKEKAVYKKWMNSYSNNLLVSSRYYLENKLVEEVFYSPQGHKVKLKEYKGSDLIRESDYKYNKEGLVESESVFNPIGNSTTTTRYRYDNQFKIKQIIKNMPDGKEIYWDVVFDAKGIVSREYYTLNDELFTFYYDSNGLELKGEVRRIVDGKEGDLKIEWQTTYSSSGHRIQKIETNYLINKTTTTLFNKDGLETKITTEYRDRGVVTELFEYNQDKKVTSYSKTENLRLNLIKYRYINNTTLAAEQHYNDGVLVREFYYNDDGTKKEVVITSGGARIVIIYDRNGTIISEEIQK